jgi:hypothetical protein
MTVGQLRTAMLGALRDMGEDVDEPETLALITKRIDEIDLGYTGKQLVDAIEQGAITDV